MDTTLQGLLMAEDALRNSSSVMWGDASSSQLQPRCIQPDPLLADFSSPPSGLPPLLATCNSAAQLISPEMSSDLSQCSYASLLQQQEMCLPFNSNLSFIIPDQASTRLRQPFLGEVSHGGISWGSTHPGMTGLGLAQGQEPNWAGSSPIFVQDVGTSGMLFGAGGAGVAFQACEGIPPGLMGYFHVYPSC